MDDQTLEDRIILIEQEITSKYSVNKQEDEDGKALIQLAKPDSIDASELKKLLQQAVQELYDLKVEYEDMQSKCTTNSLFTCLLKVHSHSGTY